MSIPSGSVSAKEARGMKILKKRDLSKVQEELTKEELKQNITDLENALCEQDAVVDGRFSAIEDAICELDEAINK